MRRMLFSGFGLWLRELSVAGCAFALAAATAALILSLDHDPLYMLLRMMLFALWLGALIRWAPGAWAAAKSRLGRMGAAEHLTLGIWMSLSGSAMLAAFAISQKWLGYPEWMRSWWPINAIIAWQMIGALLHLTAPGSEDGRVPRWNWAGIALALAIGGGFAGVLIALSVEL